MFRALNLSIKNQIFFEHYDETLLTIYLRDDWDKIVIFIPFVKVQTIYRNFPQYCESG